MNPVKMKKLVKANIKKYGWHCMHVVPNEPSKEQFTYSIGLAELFESPEIVLFGLDGPRAHRFLSVCVDLLRTGHKLLPDQPDDSVLNGDYKVFFRYVKSEHFSEYLGTAIRYYGQRAFNAMVMFFPDKDHKFPWQESYNGIDATVPLAIVNPLILA